MSQTQVKRQKFFIVKIQPVRNYHDYLATSILKDIRNRKSIDLIKSSYLNKLEIINLPNIYPLFNKFLDQAIKEDLLHIILLSRSSKEIDLACSNAATILAKSDFSFTGIDLSNIRIPKADLSQCLLINVNFANSCLKEAKFLQSHIINVNFKNCDLSKAEFGYFKKIGSQDVIGLSFSPDEELFYYRAAHNLMEMNLKSQEKQLKSRLNGFISSHLIEIYETKHKRYWTNVHGQYMEIWDQFGVTPRFVINTAKVVFSPNWKYIAALDKNSLVFSWDIEKYKQTLGAAKASTYKGSQLIFSPCSKYLAIIKAATILIIETENWTLVRSVYGKFSTKKAFAISYSGKRIACSDANVLQLIDTVTSIKTKIYVAYKKLRGLSFSPCGRFLAFGSNEDIGYVMDLKSQLISQIFTGFSGNLLSVLFSPSNKYIAWSDSNGNIRVYEFFPNFFKNDYNRHYQIHTAKISPKGTYLLTISSEKAILWDLSTFVPKQIKQIADHNSYSSFAFSPFETYLARVIVGVVFIYDIKRDVLIDHKIKNYLMHDFTFSQNEDYIIDLNGSRYEYYSLPGFEIVRKCIIQEPGITSYKFSECGRYHLCSNTRYKLFLWDLDKGDYIWRIDASYFQSKFSFTHLLKHIILFDSCGGNFIRVWNMNNKDSYGLKYGKTVPICFCFAAEENLVIAGYGHGVINIWDIKSQTVIEKIRSLMLRDVNWIEAINDHILIKEKDNIEIFKSNKLGFG